MTEAFNEIEMIDDDLESQEIESDQGSEGLAEDDMDEDAAPDVVDALKEGLRDELIAQKIFEDEDALPSTSHMNTGVRNRYSLRFRMWLGKSAHDALLQLKAKRPNQKQWPFVATAINLLSTGLFHKCWVWGFELAFEQIYGLDFK